MIDKRKREELIKADPASEEIIVPFVVGDDVRKYHINFRERYLILTKIGVDMENYPVILEHLEKSQASLERRWDKGNHWWELRACDYYEEFLKPKIVWPVIAKESRFSRDDRRYYHNDKTFFSPIDDDYLLGVLNSTSVWFLLRAICSVLGDPDRGGRLELRAIYVKQTPIPEPSGPIRQKAEVLVKEVIGLNDKLAEAFTVRQKGDLKRQITDVEREIDRIVYALYGLNESEIAIVESSGLTAHACPVSVPSSRE